MNPSVEWLLGEGKGVLREALMFLPKDLEAEFLERWRPSHVLVKAYGDGHIEVLGPKHVVAKVVAIPKCPTAGREKYVESVVEASLPQVYQDINYPSAVRASGSIKGVWGVRGYEKWDIMERQRRFDQALLEGLDRCREKLKSSPASK